MTTQIHARPTVRPAAPAAKASRKAETIASVVMFLVIIAMSVALLVYTDAEILVRGVLAMAVGIAAGALTLRVARGRAQR